MRYQKPNTKDYRPETREKKKKKKKKKKKFVPILLPPLK